MTLKAAQKIQVKISGILKIKIRVTAYIIEKGTQIMFNFEPSDLLTTHLVFLSPCHYS